MMRGESKRQRGAYYTKVSPFEHGAFRSWGVKALKHSIVEPFAGDGSLIRMLGRKAAMYDIAPAHEYIRPRDTLTSFPTGFKTCITNPPWLARNSATRRGLAFPDCEYQDVYLYAMEKCLANCACVGMLVPESFITTGLFRSRLEVFISFTERLFVDTEHPVGMALFGPRTGLDTDVWSGDAYVGNLAELERRIPTGDVDVRFNAPDGNVGFVAVDSTAGATIRFCDPMEVGEVKHSNRYHTRIAFDGEVDIESWNARLNEYRAATADVFLTAFKGLRKDGKYRRRCDWRTARALMV